MEASGIKFLLSVTCDICTSHKSCTALSRVSRMVLLPINYHPKPHIMALCTTLHITHKLTPQQQPRNIKPVAPPVIKHTRIVYIPVNTHLVWPINRTCMMPHSQQSYLYDAAFSIHSQPYRMISSQNYLLVSDEGGYAHPKNEKMKKVHPDNSFNDLHQDYQNAVDCLTQCDSTIRTMQDQLASKDKQIASLEEKLVQMSFDLASSKALEDEHRLLVRKMMSDSSHGNEDNKYPPSPQVEKKWQDIALQSLKSEMDYTPNRAVRSNTRSNRESRTAISQSWTVRRRSVVSPDIPHVPSTPQGTNKNEYSNKSRHALAVELNQHEHLLSQHPGKKSLDESFASRKLSNLSQYLLGLNKNDTAGCTLAEGDAIDISRRHLGRKKRNSILTSTGSLISAVVFPVSSMEVLAGCLRGEASEGPNINNDNEEWPEF